jgi:1,4-dihydroxy-2-naphthoyl-CoA synthase
MNSNKDQILSRKDNSIGWMIINNPERRNAISFAMREQMTRVFEEFDNDPQVRVMIIRGSGGRHSYLVQISQNLKILEITLMLKSYMLRPPRR